MKCINNHQNQNKMKIKFNFLVLLITLSLCDCKDKTTVVHPSRQQRLIYVSDMDHPAANLKFGERLLTLPDVHASVDDYADTQVTTFMVHAGEDVPVYRSKYNRLVGDDDGGRLNCGTDTALYSFYRRYYRNILNLEKDGIDIVEAQLKRAKEKGMETFLTFRMNDMHYTNIEYGYTLLYGDFWLQHPEYWLNENVGWNTAGAYDFAHPEVRQYRLNLLFEQLELYGALIDGYDLDFQRFPAFFKTGEGTKNALLMTEMVKTLKSRIDEMSVKYGKKIMLSVRVPISMDFCESEGLDVKEWINLGLIDFLTVGHFLNEDPSMPVAKFIQDLGSHPIPVYVSVDCGGYRPHRLHSYGMKRGIASHIFAQGGDGIYLFNYFLDAPVLPAEESCTHYVCRGKSRELLMELGAMETLRKRNKIFALDDGSAAKYYRYRSKSTLPLTVSADMQTVNLHVGDPLQDDTPEQIILFIRTDLEVGIGVQVNGTDVELLDTAYTTLYHADIDLKQGAKVHAFSVPVSAVKQGDNQIGICSRGDEFKVVRLEMAVRYGDVETHGYF